MIDFVTKNVNSRMITAFFDTRAAAESASASLQVVGVSPSHIAIAEGDEAAGASHTNENGFWESLKSMFLPAEDHHSYAEGLRRGGFLLSADVEPELYDRALEVVDSGGAVNMDEREASWASSGWTRFGAGETNPPPRTPPAVPTPRETVPTFDEGAVFAARDTSHGRTGLRSYRYAVPDKEQADQRFTSENGRIEDHMDVIASDGIKIGTVDHLDGENIKLAKSTSPDGMHHLVSLADVDHVDAHVHLNRTSSEVRASW